VIYVDFGTFPKSKREIFSRQYLGTRRIPSLKTLRTDANSRNRRMNRNRVKTEWKFDRKAVRRKFGCKSVTLERISRTPVRAPKANARSERLVGSIRRECLDFLIFGERHLRRILKVWVTHYNHGRVHMSLGLDIPAPLRPPPANTTQHRGLPDVHVVRCRAVLVCLHHEYWLEKSAA